MYVITPETRIITMSAKENGITKVAVMANRTLIAPITWA